MFFSHDSIPIGYILGIFITGGCEFPYYKLRRNYYLFC
jgi:hypothetical protein